MNSNGEIAAKYLTVAALLVVFLVAGIVRIAATDMHRKVVNGDETTYLFAAKSLLKYHTLTRDVDGAAYRGEKTLEPTARLSPGYPLFVAAILAAGGGVFSIYVTNIVFSVASMFLMLWIMLELRLGRVPILVALALAAIYPGFVYNLNRVLTEQLYMVLFLSFAATYIRAVRTSNAKWMAAAGGLLAAAVHVRAEAVAFAALGLVFLVVSTPKQHRTRLATVFFCAMVVMMLPWWIRNLLTLHRPLLLTDAAAGTARWGATPYYIGMPDSGGTLRQVLERNIPPAPWVFLRWRLFGFLQYMWGDVWDERLVHPVRYLRQALLIQPIAVWVPLMFAPLLVLKKIRMSMFVALIPICYTLVLEPIQALPRYIFPAVPFTFILLAILLSRTSKRGDWTEFDIAWVRRWYITCTCIFAIFLSYSVLIFPQQIAHDESEYRLARYMGIHIDQLQSPVEIKRIDLTGLPIANTVSVGDGWYRNNVDAPPVLDVNVPLLNTRGSDVMHAQTVGGGAGHVVSKVHISFAGGFYFDNAIIYWTGASTKSVSENNVYKFPVNAWGDGVTVYIDDDVNHLMIVPFEFRFAKMRMKELVVSKYEIGRERDGS